MLWIVIGLLVVVLVLRSVVIVPAGHVAVLTLFGKVDHRELPEGLHIINPLKTYRLMSVRTQSIYEEADVPSKEGLTVGVDVSVLFHLEPESASNVYQNVGLNYKEVLLVPVLRSAIRNVTVEYEAKALYTSTRQEVADKIYREMATLLQDRGIVIEKVLLRGIRLPDLVRQAIENKLAAEQEAERMLYVLEKEKREAERKRIEAQGIADFQRIVRQGIDERLLKWKALETVNELARSQNAKFIILGDKSGLPIIVQAD